MYVTMTNKVLFQWLFKEALNVSRNSAGFARDLNEDNGNWMSIVPIFVLVFTSSLYMFRAIQVYVAWSEG